MAKLRKFVCYRNIERPYTRFSKFKQLSYVRARPHCRVVRFDMGDPAGTFEYTLHLVTKNSLQIRDNALESARQTSNRVLELTLGKNGYYLQTRTYPHHILRENPLAAGAGADRLSTGMAHPFGKPIGIAAQVKKGRPIFTLHINKENLELGRQALKRAAYKLPTPCTLEVIQNKKQAVQAKKPAPAPAVAAAAA
jgi:large subunit ribosomal protein L10e